MRNNLTSCEGKAAQSYAFRYLQMFVMHPNDSWTVSAKLFSNVRSAKLLSNCRYLTLIRKRLFMNIAYSLSTNQRCLLLSAALGPLLGHFWRLLASLGPLLGRSWPLLARSWAALGSGIKFVFFIPLFCAALGALLAALDRSCGALGPLLGALGALLAALGGARGAPKSIFKRDWLQNMHVQQKYCKSTGKAMTFTSPGLSGVALGRSWAALGRS
jgi:hypothetical protein